MARLAVIFTVLFFFFAFSHARTPLDHPENNVFSPDSSITLPESDTKVTILLPSERPDIEPNTVVELEPETADTMPLERETESESVDELELNKPFTVVTFRPSNRQFPRIRGDRQSAFRLPYPCKHHHRHHFGRVGSRFNGGGSEFLYGNDMILSREDTSTDLMFRGNGMRKIPARWARFHHHGRPRFPFRHEGWNKDDMKRPFHHMEEDEVADTKHKEGGLMKRVRKFLNHF